MFNVFDASVFSQPFPSAFAVLVFGSFVSWMCFSEQISEDRKCFNFVRGFCRPIGVPPQFPECHSTTISEFFLVRLIEKHVSCSDVP